jgi:asparagine synthase (glutamine-hydrolysing)
VTESQLFDAYNNIKIRGPERSEFFQWKEFTNIYLGFHRLSIMDQTVLADQPFVFEDETRKVMLSCNGEIYNFEELIKEHELPVKSHSDCEVILHLYLKYGVQKTIDLLNGEFAVFIFDLLKKQKELDLYLFRDHCGIRPLFYGEKDQSFGFCSEIKGLTHSLGTDKAEQIVDHIQQFPPRKFLKLRVTMGEDKRLAMKKEWTDYTTFQDIPITITDKQEAMEKIRKVFYKAVKDRIQSDRPMGALLSGGLDSSLTASIFARELAKQGRKLYTFSIGMPGATDRKYAEMVAEKIGSIHKHVEFSKEDFLGAVEKIVEVTETFDITTIRATTGNYLIGKWISENTDIKVVLIGDGSDELTSGYMYFFNAPSPLASHKENIRLIEDIHKYDVLRADRGVADNGLEARVPFLDKAFIRLYLSIEPKLRVPTMCDFGIDMEKALLRDAFKDEDLLPREVLYRRKEAFSDGVSS